MRASRSVKYLNSDQDLYDDDELQAAGTTWMEELTYGCHDVRDELAGRLHREVERRRTRSCSRCRRSHPAR